MDAQTIRSACPSLRIPGQAHVPLDRELLVAVVDHRAGIPSPSSTDLLFLAVGRGNQQNNLIRHVLGDS